VLIDCYESGVGDSGTEESVSVEFSSKYGLESTISKKVLGYMLEQ